MRAQFCAGLFLFAVMTSPAAARTEEPLPAADAASVTMLKAGDFHWYDAESAPGAITLVVSVPAQMAYVYRDSQLIAVTTVSTGMPGKDTPTGTFPILEKRVMHHSNLYDGAPMPFMQRLTWDGIALHAGQIPGYPASHGCVRLPKEFAKKLFGLTAVGAQVSIVDAYIDDPRNNPWVAAPAPAPVLAPAAPAAPVEPVPVDGARLIPVSATPEGF